MPITIHPELEAKLRARAEAVGVTVETYIFVTRRPALGERPVRCEARSQPRSRRLCRVTGFEDKLILVLPLPEGVDILRVVHGSRNLRALLRREGIE